MKRFLLPVFVLFAMSGFTSVFAQQVLVKPVYIDVRSWVEHQADSIDGDARIHVSEIVAGVSEQFPDKNTPIHLYCAVGGRAGIAAASLTDAGYTNVHNAGGIDDVRRARDLKSKTD